MKNNNILVSVIVVSYNSEKTIEETLNSIKSQSYDNIELIISDDGSKDNTIDICKRWLQINGKVFSCYQLITVELNSGIPANCNRSLKASNADWVKFIAGDDTLKRDCVKENVKYINLHNDIEVLQTSIDVYNENFNERSYQITRPNFSSHNFFEMEASKQNNYLKNKNNPVCAPSIFLKKSVIERANGFDERFTLMEDFPLWLNITRLGIKIHFLELATVNYRLHSKSIIKSEKVNISAKFAKSYLYFLKNYFLPKDRNFKIKKDIFKFRVYIFLEKLGLNNNYILSKVLYAIVDKL